MVQWLRLCTFTAKGLGSITGGGTRISQVIKHRKKKNLSPQWEVYVWYGEVTRKLNSRLPPYLLLAQSCPILCNPSDCSLLGSSVHGILQARILEWVAISFSRESSQPRDWTRLSPIASRFFTIWAPREAPGYPQISSISYRSTDLRTMSTKVICSLSFMVEPITWASSYSTYNSW